MPKTLDEAIDEVVADLPDNSDLEPEQEPTDPEVVEEDEADVVDVDEPEVEDLEEDLEDGPSDEDDDVDADVPEGAIELAEDDEVVLPDGSVVNVKEAALRHADYTRKTQEVAEQRRKLEQETAEWRADRDEILALEDRMRSWLEEKTSDPAGWTREIVSEADNPTQTIAQAIVALNEEGRLDPAFVEQFRLDAPDSAVARSAASGAEAERIRRLEQRAEQQDQSVQQQQTRRQMVAQMFSQWDQLKLEQGLAFDSPEAEHEARRETLKFAIENDLVNRVDIAHDALVARRPSTKKSPATTQVPDKKKRATRSMSSRSTGSSRKPAPKKAKTVEGAAALAVEDWLARG